jgi:hypothetical protein
MRAIPPAREGEKGAAAVTWRPMRLVQLSHPSRGRRVALVEEPHLRLLADAPSVGELAFRAIRAGRSRLIAQIEPTDERLPYDPIYAGESDWSLLPPFDHDAPEKCFVTGTGLTHKASAENRQSMHVSTPLAEPREAADPPATDSMKMYRIGLEGGRPAPGQIGAAPEWFYKGTGHILRAHNQALDVPNHGDDGGEEAEIAGCYVIAPDGTPYRVGLVQANEFSDHVMEAKNYLYLAQSKLRDCSIGPEIVTGGDLTKEIRGVASIERGGKTIWSGPLASGEPWMCHTLANLEHHHFKHAEHRRAGDAHVHFFGADLFSFKDRLVLEDGDVMVVTFEGFGRPLRNSVRIDRSEQEFVGVKML